MKTYLVLFLIVAGGAMALGEDPPDSYRWLEDAGSARTQAWVADQNHKAEGFLAAVPGRDKIAERLRVLYDAGSISLPQEAGGKLFYKRTSMAQDQPTFYWTSVAGPKDEHPWLEPAAADDHSTVGEWTPSPDGQFVAYASHAGGADEAVLHIRNVARDSDMPGDTIRGATFASVSWMPHRQGFYYMRLPIDPSIPAADRVARADIRFHSLGTVAAEDRLIYPPTGDASRYLSPQVSEDGNWIFIEDDHGWTNDAIYYSSLVHSSDALTFRPLFVSSSAVASIAEWKNEFYLFTNQNASNGKILKRAARADLWETVVPERPDSVIESMHIVGGDLVLVVLKNAADHVEVYRSDGRRLWDIPLPEQGVIWSIGGREDRPDLYIRYESFFVPPCIFRANLTRQKLSVWKKTDIPVDGSKYKTELVGYTSKDGTKISMMMVRPRNLIRNGKAPLLLEGYGGFNTPILPRFSQEVVAWLEMGGVYAVPHLRGGGEYGEKWHQAGMLTHKQNTFDDFISAAEFLIKQGYTRSQSLAIQGASNGGLLVAAALTQRPDLFRAAICKNPLTDMLRYPLYGEGKAWIPEYGDPQDIEQFRVLSAYSPYHHVKMAAYPSILMFAGEHDDRVDPMHARKFTAALQAANTSTNPILFRLLAHSGHSSADQIQTEVDETADRLLFLKHELSMK